MNGGTHIVVVDDEPDLRETVQEYLALRGYRVSAAEGGAALRRIVAEDPADLVLLDLRMPGEDGLSVARWLRANTRAAIVMLTASGEVIDRIVGLEMGADDYLPKPADLRELHARVKAVLRRAPTRTDGENAAATRANTVQFGNCHLDLDAHVLHDARGREVRLTAMEFDLLKAFADHPNRVLTRDQLLDLAHNRDGDPFDRSIDLRIARIRRKIESDPKNPQVIRTVHGAGYVFRTGKA